MVRRDRGEGGTDLSAFAIIVLVAASASPAAAAEFGVRSETVGEAYRIRGRDGLFSLPRTRLIQNLTLFGGHVFKPETPLGISFDFVLAIDHDFNVAEAEMDPGSLARYSPLVRKTSVGLLRGWLAMTWGRFRRMEVKIGRQTANDVTGMYAFDGVKMGISWFGVAASNFAFGFETIPMFNFAVVDFSPEGISWGDRRGLPDDVHPEITQPRLRPMFAADFRVFALPDASLSIGYRRSYTALKMEAVSYEKLSFGLYSTNEKSFLGARLTASWDFLWQRISEMIAGIRFRFAPRWHLDIDLVHIYPVFDSSSIFNVFMFDPFGEASAGVSFEPREEMIFSLGGLMRQTRRYGTVDGGNDFYSDAGGWFRLTVREDRWRLTAGSRMTGGESGRMAGLDASAELNFWREILVLRLGSGLWFFENPLRAGHHTISGGGTCGAAWTLRPGVRLLGSVNVFDNRISGFGISTTWVLAVTL